MKGTAYAILMKEDSRADPWRIQNCPEPVRDRVLQPTTTDQDDLVAGDCYVGLRPLSTDVDACGSDASIAFVRSHDVNPGANLDRARGDSLACLIVAGTRCRVDRNRTATGRFSHDRSAIHARHNQRLTLAMCSWCGSKRLRAIGAIRCESQPLGVIGASLGDCQRWGATGPSGRKGRSLGRTGRRTHDRAYAQGKHEGKGQSHLRPR